MKDDYGKKIKEFRRRLGKSQTELANELGVTQTVISNWEMGRSKVKTNMIEKLCKALNISADEFLEIDKIPLKTLSIDELVIPDTDNITKRYYELDDHGKEAVRTILEIEYARVKHDT